VQCDTHCFIRGAWTAVRRILAPVASKTASNEAVKFEAAVAYQELDGPEPVPLQNLDSCPELGFCCVTRRPRTR
jgi:hypothetical protein